MDPVARASPHCGGASGHGFPPGPTLPLVCAHAHVGGGEEAGWNRGSGFLGYEVPNSLFERPHRQEIWGADSREGWKGCYRTRRSLNRHYLLSASICFKIQFPMNSNTEDSMVSGINIYSEDDPVLQVWKRWFIFGNSLTV